MDSKDEKILEVLRENSRLSAQQISRKTLIPITTVHNRMKKLVTEGIIKKFTIDVNPVKIGKTLAASAEKSAKRSAASAEKSAKRAAKTTEGALDLVAEQAGDALGFGFDFARDVLGSALDFSDGQTAQSGETAYRAIEFAESQVKPTEGRTVDLMTTVSVAAIAAWALTKVIK